MGIARGIFVVDTHVHAQRHAFKFKERGIKPDFRALATDMPLVEVYDNSDRLLYHMERYGVDMCVIQPAFGMTNELNVQIVKKHPDKFVALCNAVQTSHKAERGEIEWNIEAVCKEIDEQLATGNYVGIGEGITMDTSPEGKITWPERFEQICQIMEVAKKYNVPISYHTGTLSGYGGARAHALHENDWADPLLAHNVAAEYPDVPIILAHGGMQGWWSEMYMDACFQVAASHPNVYLETGLYWAELYEKPLRDPNIGVEKLIWGTDWGASIPQQWVPGFHPASYADQSRRQGIPAHQVDCYGWSLRQLAKAVDMLDLPQDDVNLILGGNAVRLFKLEDKLPYRRLFKEYLK
jgi:predicted TIM-barrel fold metal-dependent hydrolase